MKKYPIQPHFLTFTSKTSTITINKTIKCMSHIKYATIALLAILTACKSPIQMFFEDITKEIDKDASQEAKLGWIDGCKSGIIHQTRPGILKYHSQYTLNPYLLESKDYTDARFYSNAYCTVKFAYLSVKDYDEVFPYLDHRGDYIKYSK